MSFDTLTPAPGPSSTPAPVPDVDIVVPVLNEERALGPSIRRLAAYLSGEFPFRAVITIADNGSTDGTWAIATELACKLPGVRTVRLAERGKGRAVRECWLASEAEVVAYMDVDLSTGLEGLLPLVAPLFSGHSDLAIGTRLARGARVIRGPRREIVSRCYNLLLQVVLDAGFSDAHCGFKAMRTDKARLLIPLVQDNAWFFDTELLILAERAGLRIHEVPVDWVDDLDSRADVVGNAIEDLRGIARLCWGGWRGTPAIPGELVTGHAKTLVRSLPGQVVRFAGIGVVSMISYILLYLLFRITMNAQAANVVSLLLTTIANTTAHRRVTFGIRGHSHIVQDQLQGAIAFAAGLALTAVTLAALHAVAPRPPRIAELAVLIAASLAASVARFVLYRSWVFRPRQAPSRPRLPAATVLGEIVPTSAPMRTMPGDLRSAPATQPPACASPSPEGVPR
jgi:glycosyltransferase involved in cell wall biosynthesis